MEDSNALYIYTDGSSSTQGTRHGGVGVRLVFPDSFETETPIIDFELPGYRGGSIGQMELQAAIEALKQLVRFDKLTNITRVIICSDSQYVVDGYPRSVYSWPKNKWIGYDGTPIANVSEWKELVKLSQKVSSKFYARVEFQKVKGHSGNEHNEAVDKLAKKSRTNPQKEKSKSAVVRKKGPEAHKTVRGSIHAVGQLISIRVVTSEYLNHHKKYKLRCEVLTKTSPYYKSSDFLFSSNPLRANHKYLIRMGKEGTYCEVAKIIRELE